MVRVRQPGEQADEAPGPTVRPSGQAATLAWCLEVVRQVNDREASARASTDDELRSRTGDYRARLARGEAAEALLPDAFATVREAARRAIGLRHHDVQIMGGAVLHRGMVAEMRTGEGKTLTATLPAYLGAMSKEPVHVMSANDYLTTRDRDWMQPVYQFLGLSAGLLAPASDPDRAARRGEYAADVVYGQWDQFGCDLIRDNLARERGEQVQRGLGLAIVDEADLILLDQMRASALISGPASESAKGHESAAEAVRQLRPGQHYLADRLAMTASLTEGGISAVENWFGIANLYDTAHGGLVHLVENAVRARALYERDRDYLVSGDQIVVIDSVSGRPLVSRYSDGMHEALEAKEGLPVRPSRQVIGSVLGRDYLRQYQRLAGMTGTAASDAPAYRELYGLEVITIPTNTPVIRVDHPDRLYRTRQAKLTAIAADTAARAASRQPVLVGAMSEADAEAVARLLTDAGTSFELLSARNFEREATVLADSGRPGAVTIVVKMAGRGVDIVLGGASAADREIVAGAGGLCVLGTERNGDRRTELHLRGRAGRQGDPGESLFYLSADDEVVGQLLRYAPKSLLPEDGTAFKRLARDLDRSQFRVAVARSQWYQRNAAFDDVLARQQRVVYAERNSVLLHTDLRARVVAILDELLTAEVKNALRAESDLQTLVARLKRLYPVTDEPAIQVARDQGGRDPIPVVLAVVLRDARQAYQDREAQLGERVMRALERAALLAATDHAWREHLAAMSDLEASAAIRAAGGTPSLPDFQREAAALYASTTNQIRRTAVGHIFYHKLAGQDPD